MAKKAGITCGTIAYSTTFILLAPVACIASTGRRSISSIASPISLPMKPIDRNITARMPASTPGPKMATNSRAQMMVFTERLDTRINRPSHRVALFGVVFCAAI